MSDFSCAAPHQLAVTSIYTTGPLLSKHPSLLYPLRFGCKGLLVVLLASSPRSSKGKGALENSGRVRNVAGKTCVAHIKHHAEESSARYSKSYTVNACLLLRLAVVVARDEVGTICMPSSGGALARCCPLPAPSPCAAAAFEDLGIKTWGVKSKRDAGALDMGGRAGCRLDGALCGTPKDRGPRSCDDFCRSGWGGGRQSRWGEANFSMQIASS